MKKIKLIFIFVILVLIGISCENDGGTSNLGLETGAVPDVQKIASTDAFINLLGLQSGKTIDLGFTVDVGQGNVQSMDVVLYYLSGSKVTKAIFATNITKFPNELHLSQIDLFKLFPQLKTAADFKLGDQLKVSTILTLKNGNKLNILNDDGSPNYGQDIANSTIYKVSQSYLVSCPSNLAGTYSVLSSGASTDPGPSADKNPVTNFPYTVKIVSTGGGAYTMSDGYGGLYKLWYDIYGIDKDYPGNFSDVCDKLSGTYTEPFGSKVTLSGTVNSNGTLSIHWENEYGDFGDGVYTKK